MRSSTILHIRFGSTSFHEFPGDPLQAFSTLDQMDVKKSIGQAPNKSCARDPLPTWMVKDLADELAPFITVLFNKSISDGYFPRNFRVAEITPILMDPCVIGSSGVGIKDGANVAKSPDVVLAGLAYQAHMFVESKR